MRSPSSLARTRGAVMLAAEAFDHLAARIHEFHRAISDLPFDTLKHVPVAGSGTRGTRVVHDGITDGVYGAIRGTAKALFGAADSAMRAVEGSNFRLALPAPSAMVRDTRVQDDLVAALSGVVGDHMAVRRNPLAVRFGAYRDGRRIANTGEGLAAAFPAATPRLAVFVHGLCCNENAWRMYEDATDPETRPYPERLAADLGYTPVYVRYNSGLHISINGRSLSRTLDALVAHWPTRVDEVVLVGHSMGALVARSGVELARRRRAAWLSKLTQVICLGAPHLGAPLEKVVHVGTTAMKRARLSQPLAKFLDSRSRGIKDLRWGYTADEEWKGRDPDAFWADDRLQMPPAPGVRYRFLGACLTRDPSHPLSRAVGDGLVRVPSSLATDIAGADGALRVQMDHIRMLNHPEIYERIREWLAVST